MNHQTITGILKSAGYQSQVAMSSFWQNGYQVVQLSGAVGVLCGPYDSAQLSTALVEAGLRVYQNPLAARDALFVKGDAA